MNTIISFNICPFVQRSIINMNYKKIPYKVKYIDLANPPEWFLNISPLGKVPVLQVGDEIIFESAVINEYIDDTNAPSLFPADALKKAQERSFIELTSVVTMDFYQASMAQTKEDFISLKETFEKNLSTLLTKYQGPYFRGDEFSLVDTSAIPMMHRLFLMPHFNDALNLTPDLREKLTRWSDLTLAMDAVKKSVPDTFEEDMNTYLSNGNSYIHAN